MNNAFFSGAIKFAYGGADSFFSDWDIHICGDRLPGFRYLCFYN